MSDKPSERAMEMARKLCADEGSGQPCMGSANECRPEACSLPRVLDAARAEGVRLLWEEIRRDAGTDHAMFPYVEDTRCAMDRVLAALCATPAAPAPSEPHTCGNCGHGPLDANSRCTAEGGCENEAKWKPRVGEGEIK